MLQNYLKTAWRSLWRHKVFSLINIVGLGVGIGCCLLIALFVTDELAFDAFHAKSDRIYRVISEIKQVSDGSVSKNTGNGWPLGRELKDTYPEIEEVVYLRQPRYAIKHRGQYYFENIITADNNFLQVFSFPLLKGNPHTALAEPNSLVLSEKMAYKYFGREEALGKTLVLNDSLLFRVTGVVKNVPAQSHLQFDALVSFATFTARNSHFYTNQGWFDLNMYNYVLLRPGTNVAAFSAKVKGLAMAKAGEFYSQFGYECAVTLQPLKEIYLHSADTGNGLGPVGNINTVYLLSAIAGFILLIACINYMNLATARSVERAKEIGIRKVIGSTQGALVQQFLTESFLTCLLAFMLALELAVLLMPYFNQLAGKQYIFNHLLSLEIIRLLAILLVVVSLLAGLYPAFVLARFQPIQVLKGVFRTGKSGVSLRKGLVVFQFAISCILILSTLVVTRQLMYMQNQDLGFTKNQVLVIDASKTPYAGRAQQYQAFKQTLRTHAAVKEVAAALTLPGRSGWRGQLVVPEGRPQDDMLSVEYLAADQDFVPALGLQIIAGRNFSPDFATDQEEALLINEAAVREMNFGSPEKAIGKHINSPSGYPEGVVVGVVKDYHQHGLQEKIRPVVVDMNPNAFQVFALRIKPQEVAATLAHLKKTWHQFFNGYTFEYYFLDEDFAQQYEKEARLAKMAAGFAALAIFIAGLGLFGLVAFTTVQRTKEIGIRKVLGASVPNIVLLLSKDFLKLVLLANVIAWPLAWWAMHHWLQNFAYRIQVGVGLFALTGIIALLLAFITLSFQAIKAAVANPVQSLRSE